ncbi:MAG TPA: TraB/GumN family protein, partial [Kofleriaceae bacterium]|nr:TraB/GumN family protein [Kofleriaceae bacterium]
ALKKMKPAFAQMMLSLSGVDPSKSMELEFVGHAKQAGVEIGALETVEEQLAALEASMDIDGLKKAIDEHDENAEALTTLITAYREGDLKAFMAIFEPADEADRVGDALLGDRNEKWVPQIEAILADGGDVFIAVGAGHLYGEKGVVPLLEARGVRGECMLPTAQP